MFRFYQLTDIGNKIPLLNLFISKLNDSLRFNVYRKLTATDGVLFFISCHLFFLPISPEDFEKELNVIKQSLLTESVYRSSVIPPSFQSFQAHLICHVCIIVISANHLRGKRVFFLIKKIAVNNKFHLKYIHKFYHNFSYKSRYTNIKNLHLHLYFLQRFLFTQTFFGLLSI